MLIPINDWFNCGPYTIWFDITSQEIKTFIVNTSNCKGEKNTKKTLFLSIKQKI